MSKNLQRWNFANDLNLHTFNDDSFRESNGFCILDHYRWILNYQRGFMFYFSWSNDYKTLQYCPYEAISFISWFEYLFFACRLYTGLKSLFGKFKQPVLGWFGSGHILLGVLESSTKISYEFASTFALYIALSNVSFRNFPSIKDHNYRIWKPNYAFMNVWCKSIKLANIFGFNYSISNFTLNCSK